MDVKVALSFTEIRERVKEVAPTLPEVDWVVGIATGGVVPASLLAYELDKPLSVIHINYRAEDNTPQRPVPELLGETNIPPEAQRILLVDDVSVTGQTMTLAKNLLINRTVTTFVMKGQGDYVIFPEVAACVFWPWKLS